MDYIVREALKRREIFENLDKYLCRIYRLLKTLDPSMEAYLFGSVAENRYLYSSDIDILVVTDLRPGIVLSYLWRNGIEEPFEIHVIPSKLLPIYAKRAKLISLKKFCNKSL